MYMHQKLLLDPMLIFQIMTVGVCKGEKVQDAKKKVQSLMVDTNEVVLYQEPKKTIISRSGDKCVVALCYFHQRRKYNNSLLMHL